MNLEDIAEYASALDHPPKRKVPKKWLFEPISMFIRLLILPFVALDLIAQKIAKFLIRPPYMKTGKCKKRGNCCYFILVRRCWGIFGSLDLFWHTQINGFYRLETKPQVIEGKKYHLMGCRYLCKDGSCRQHFLRPTICRQWPRIEIFGAPELLKGCGYVPKQRSLSKLPILEDS